MRINERGWWGQFVPPLLLRNLRAGGVINERPVIVTSIKHLQIRGLSINELTELIESHYERMFLPFTGRYVRDTLMMVNSLIPRVAS